jgi:hypothetical protein
MSSRPSIFRDIPVINAYLTRCQSVLQQGKPHNDILLYWQVYDLLMNGGKGEKRFTVPGWHNFATRENELTTLLSNLEFVNGVATVGQGRILLALENELADGTLWPIEPSGLLGPVQLIPMHIHH